MKNKVNQVRAGAVMSYINMAIGSLIPMFYTPIMLSLLGQDEYGLYKLASTVTSYLSLISFGLGSALVRYYTKYRAAGDKEGEENMFGLFTIIFSIISAVTVIAGIVIACCIDIIYGKSIQGLSSFGMSKIAEMRILIIILSVQTALNFFASPYTSIVTSHEKFVFLQITNIITTVIIPIINIVVLYFGFASIGLVVSSFIITLITQIIYFIYVRKNIGLRPRYNNLPKNLIKEILAFSMWIFIMNIIDKLYNSTDTLIIGYIPALSTIGVAVYSIGVTFQTMICNFSSGLTSVITPKINMMVFGDSSSSELTDTMIRIGRLQCYIVSLIASGFITFGQQFINLWVGQGYSEAYWVALSVTIPACIPLVQNVALNIIIAQNKLKFRTAVFAGIAVANVFGTILCVNQFGIVGAAIVTGAAYVMGQGFLMNWYYWKKIKLDIPRFWKNIGPMFIFPAVLSVVSIFALKYISINSWFMLFVLIIIYTLIFILFNWFFVMNQYEKDIFIKPVKRILRKN